MYHANRKCAKVKSWGGYTHPKRKIRNYSDKKMQTYLAANLKVAFYPET